MGNHEETIRLAKESLLGQPGWVHNYFHMANSMCLQERVAEARDALSSAQAINPFLTPALFVDNINRITGESSKSLPFTGGLLSSGLAGA